MLESKRELYKDTLLRFLDIWADDLGYFEDQQGLARCLMDDCLDDSRNGYVNPTPWLALADLIEESGSRTLIRDYAMAYFYQRPLVEDQILRRRP